MALSKIVERHYNNTNILHICVFIQINCLFTPNLKKRVVGNSHLKFLALEFFKIEKHTRFGTLKLLESVFRHSVNFPAKYFLKTFWTQMFMIPC